MPQVEGRVGSGFEQVAEAFEQALMPDRDETAQCCVQVGDETVADLWTGPADAIQVVLSATKGATAACANLLVQRGVLDLDAPVARYWPEYAVNGKQTTLVRWLLAHKAGVLGPPAPLTMDDLADWDTVVAALAAATPVWEPGSRYGYHAQSFGWLVGELVRRVDGRSLGVFFREEIATPADAEFWIGLPDAREPRLAALTSDLPTLPPDTDLSQLDPAAFVGPLQTAAFTFNDVFSDDVVTAAGDRRLRAIEHGAAGGVSNGRGLSRLYRWLLEHFSPETISDICRPETHGPDSVLSSPAMAIEQTFGRGFEVAAPAGAPGGARAFGHGGAGGITAFGDPDRQLSFGYATTRIVLGPPGADARAAALVRAVYCAVG
jgi:CubicO group peptidase (beta-lactamase class C family)